MMTQDEFAWNFERLAHTESQHYSALPVSELLAKVEAHDFGESYQIWYSIGERATPAEANNLLFSFLCSDADYLLRYHCAAALIAINKLKSEGWEPEHLSGDEAYPVADNLKKIRRRLFGADDADGA